MSYRFKALQELGWAILIAVALVVLPTLLTFDPATITDWRTWATALGVAALRAAVGRLLEFVQQHAAGSPELHDLADRIADLSVSDRARLLAELEERQLGAPHG